MSRNEDVPDYKSIEFFEQKILQGHSRITSFSRTGYQTFAIKRKRGDTLHVYLTDLYTIGIADYLNIRNSTDCISAIVTASGYNEYTDEAKRESLQDHIGLFTMGEFKGALNYENYWEYTVTKKNGIAFADQKWGA